MEQGPAGAAGLGSPPSPYVTKGPVQPPCENKEQDLALCCLGEAARVPLANCGSVCANRFCWFTAKRAAVQNNISKGRRRNSSRNSSSVLSREGNPCLQV